MTIESKDIVEIKNSLEKRRYHQKLLLDIACHENPDELLFFQQIIMYDLDEKQVSLLLEVLQYLKLNKISSDTSIQELKEFDINVEHLTTEEDKLIFLEKSAQKLKINIPIKYLLLSLQKQQILQETCKKLLSAIK
ncbi:hypothetical protein ACU64V_09570 [Lysinibacillus capsici]|uniref:hypothetical protein n=1 Tax=Lysinibacillus capsici TaxID=2115968 RepID=UPI0028EBE0A0|nr:hypothetical protein [Lysinibacillus capsici]MED3796132.1 hypothetical protein [Lysinibacillus capsici]MED4554494.1 hypothetical protein [Lysinibacillus capsici]